MLASQLVTVRNHLGLLFNWGAKKKSTESPGRCDFSQSKARSTPAASHKNV